MLTDRPEGAPAIILALQSFNQDLTSNPLLHALATEGLVCSDDIFLPVPTIDALLLEHVFSRRVFNLLLRHQKLTPELVQAMHSWKHSGFSEPARGSPTPAPTETSVCRADADGFIYAQDFPPDE